MDMMLFFAVPLAAIAGFIGYSIGLQTSASPTEDEMIERIKQIRLERRLRAQIDAELQKELNP